MTEVVNQRTIKSWIKRHPRLSDSQKKIIESYNRSIHFTPDDKEEFLQQITKDLKNFDSLILDIGFGLGHSLVHSATESPNCLVIGFDPHPNGSSHTLREVQTKELKNIRIYQGDCNDILINQEHIKAQYIHIFFPDPWPKKKHHKRRLIQKDFLLRLKDYLAPEGVIHIATDWQDYACHIEQSIDTQVFSTQRTHVKQQTITRAKTKYELRGIKLGHEIYEFFLQIQNK